MNPIAESMCAGPARKPLLVAALLAVLLGAAGCTTTPEPSDELRSARKSLQAIESNEDVTRNAAESFDRSSRSLGEAERLLANGAEMARVNHYAYLAEQYAAIAREEAEQAKLQRELDLARTRRQEVQLELERRQSQAAQDEAQSAKRVAAELQAKLSDLQAKMTERGVVLTLGDVLFDFDEASLKPGGERVAERLAEFMQEFPDHRIRVEGHTDSVGPEAYNRKLSSRRAVAVEEAIVEQGISMARIDTRGYGEQYPVASNDNDAGRQRNRRVEVVVSDAQGRIKSR